MRRIIQMIREGETQIYNDDQFGDQGIRMICDQDIQKVKILQFGYSMISAKGMSYFCKAKWQNIEQLYLQYNCIGARGCKYLSRTVLTNLKILDLFGCQIQNKGVLHISKMQGKMMINLELSLNCLSDEGIKLATKGNYSLTNIGIKYNDVSLESLYNLLLMSTPQLACVYSTYCAFNGEKWIQMRDILYLKSISIINEEN